MLSLFISSQLFSFHLSQFLFYSLLYFLPPSCSFSSFHLAVRFPVPQYNLNLEHSWDPYTEYSTWNPCQLRKPYSLPPPILVLLLLFSAAFNSLLTSYSLRSCTLLFSFSSALASCPIPLVLFRVTAGGIGIKVLLKPRVLCPDGVTTRKTIVEIFTGVRTSNLTEAIYWLVRMIVHYRSCFCYHRC
jgi:hypothetical protein